MVDNVNQKDITDELSEEDLAELKAQLEEDPFANTVFQEEYKEFLNKWRRK